MAQKKKPHPASTGAATKPTSDSRYSTASLHRQTRLVLDVIRDRPASTLQLIQKHGVIRPSARINDLRNAGFLIHTEIVTEYDDHGRMHRKTAMYHFAGRAA